MTYSIQHITNDSSIFKFLIKEAKQKSYQAKFFA